MQVEMSVMLLYADARVKLGSACFQSLKLKYDACFQVLLSTSKCAPATRSVERIMQEAGEQGTLAGARPGAS